MSDNVVYLPGCEPETEQEPVTIRVVLDVPQTHHNGLWMLPVWFLVGFIPVALLLW